MQTLAPVTPEYVPAGQFAHTADAFAPVTPEYFPAGHARQSVAAHVVLVRSTPCTIAFAIAVVASVLRNSSTTKRPAMSPLKKFAEPVLPSIVEDTVLSVGAVEPVVVDTTPFTVKEETLVDVR